MAIADIINAIEQDTAQKLDEMRRAHQQRMVELKRAGEDRIESYRKKVSAQKESKKKQLMEKARTHAAQQHRNAVTKKKQQLIDEAYAKLLEKLASASDEKIRAFITRCMEDISDANGTIYPAKKHAAILTSLLADRPYLNIGESIDATGGFRFEGENIERDFTFENIVQTQLKPETEPLTPSLLFA